MTYSTALTTTKQLSNQEKMVLSLKEVSSLFISTGSTTKKGKGQFSSNLLVSNIIPGRCKKTRLNQMQIL